MLNDILSNTHTHTDSERQRDIGQVAAAAIMRHGDALSDQTKAGQKQPSKLIDGHAAYRHVCDRPQASQPASSRAKVTLPTPLIISI